jgi:PAS domain S-box-containing protein|tara:strand:- start:323829 stop:326567 length:2739 start_codon:yes stop_codon:yes gene_type:complete
MSDSIKNNKNEKKNTRSIAPATKARVSFISLGEVAVLINAILIIVGGYMWVKPIVAQHNNAPSTAQIEQIDHRIQLDFDLIESELRDTARSLAQNNAIDTRAGYQELIKASFPDTKFDQFFWIKKTATRLRVYPLISPPAERRNESYNFSLNTPDKPVIASLLKNMSGIQQNETHADFNPEHTTMFTEELNEETSVLVQPFTLSQKVYGLNNELLGYLIGLTRSNKAFDLHGLSVFPSLTYLTVNEAKSNVTLLAYSTKIDSLKKLLGKIEKREVQLNKWSGYQFNSHTETIHHAGSQVLEYALNAFLVFGVFYAAFLFSVVRSNRVRRVRALHEKDDLIKRTISLGYEASEKEELQSRVDNVEQKNIALLNSINDIIVEANMDGTVVFVNGAWNRVTNLGNLACLDRKLFDLIDDENTEQYKKEFLMLVRGHKDRYSFSTKLICNGGELKDVDIVLTPIQINETNEDVRVVGTITNMQERNQAQQALIEVEARYKSIWERAAFGLFQLGVDGKYITANPALFKILGYQSLPEMQASIDNANKQVYVNYRERMKFLRALEQNNEIKNWETQIKRKDGVLIWINENSRLVRDAEGHPIYIEGSIENVTERVETSSSLQSAKMDSDMANRAKSEFLANMSHELRTPLNSIIGFSEIIRDEVMGPIGQKAYWEYARDINNSGQRLLRIINEILDISRIETGERELNDSMVDLKKLSEKCVDILGGKIHSAELNLVIEIPDETPNILGEELAIKQMLMNILSNAIKFTPSKGKITISAEVEDKGSLRFAITDTGIGINENEVESALSPFTQLDGSDLSRQNSGTGLGLTLVNALIKMHNGRLELVSQKGIGTTATLLFPLDRVLPKNVSRSELQMMATQPDYNAIPKKSAKTSAATNSDATAPANAANATSEDEKL